MYTKAVRDFKLKAYGAIKGINSRFLRFAYPHDAGAPYVATQYPGRNHLENLDSLQSSTTEVEYHNAMRSFINFKKSKGNYFVDTDGNTILDLNAAASGFVLGYNEDDAVNSRFTSIYDRFLTHKVNANALPSHDLADIIRDNVMPWAPEGMTEVHFGGGSTGTEANELAVSVAMRHYA